MPSSREHLKKSVYIMMNDVIEQCFKKMIHLPHEGEELNIIINEATKEINHFVTEIDNNMSQKSEIENKVLNDSISSELKEKSLNLLRRVQKVGSSAESKIS